MSKKLVLSDGDAVLVVRADGTIQLAVPSDEPARAPTIIVIGLALALENEGWRRALIERTKQRMADIGG